MMSTANTDKTLAAIPTDQLVLKLLQELAARVEKLERRDEAVEGSTTSNSEISAEMPQNESSDAASTSPKPEDCRKDPEAQPATAGVSPEVDGEIAEARESACPNCKEQDSRCECIRIPYSYLLDGEEASRDMVKISDKFESFAKTSPLSAERLSIAKSLCIPADGRLKLVNFLRPSSDLEAAIKWCEEIRKSSGTFWVVDFFANGESVFYGSDLVDNVRLGSGNEFARLLRQKSAITAPLICCRQSSLGSRLSGPWKRLIVIEGHSATARTWDRTGRYVLGPIVAANFKHYALTAHYIGGHSLQYHILNVDPGFGEFCFQLCWYKILSDFEVPGNGVVSWKRGRLHGDSDDHRCILAEKTYTVFGVCDLAEDYWTIVLLTPPLSMRYADWHDIKTASEAFKYSSLHMSMVVLVLKPMKAALHGWRSLHAYIGHLIGTGEEIFDIEGHDKMIFDDNLFTRSRKYFWVINCIQEADNLIVGNIETWVQYRDKVLLPHCEKQGQKWNLRVRDSVIEGIKKCDGILREIEKCRGLLKEQRDKAMALRDGLFSASAVMESRASTRLGENVKLLTYVSIFYLPLAFCTSVWSTADTFGFNNLAYTMLAVGLLTYITVFNLNHIVKIGKQRYHQLKSSTVEKMRSDTRISWKDIGELFHRYEPKTSSETAKPSEWWVLLYQMRRLVDVVGLAKKATSTDESDALGEGTNELPKAKWYGRLFGRRSRKLETEPQMELGENR